MNLLYQIVSALTAMLVIVAWVRPETFRFLMDKESGFHSLGRQGQYTAMLTSTWVLVSVTLLKEGDIQEWLFIGFMLAWAGAQFGSLWLKTRPQQGTVTNTSSVTSSSTVTPAVTPKPTNQPKGETQ